MQTTLLGLAIALILALAAALVGPYFVDWSGYRAAFEAQASRIVGARVRISGPIEARLLPAPSLELRSVEAAAGEGPAGEAAFSARALRFELALGPLLRGEWRVSELTAAEPQIRFWLDKEGRLRAPAFGSALAAAGADPDRLAIERFTIEGGRAVLADAASGAAVTLEKLDFSGELRSLAGPFKGEGRFVAAGEPFRFRFATGRRAEGGVRLRATLDAVDRPLLAEADGTLAVTDDGPRYEGAATLAQPAGAQLSDGRTVKREPWRVTAQATADQRRARFDQVEFQYGPEGGLVRLAGKADLTLGPQPRYDAALSGRAVDLDRLLGTAGAASRPPAAVLEAALRAAFAAAPARLPGAIEIDLDAVAAGGATFQGVHGKARLDGERWDIEQLEFRAPGYTQARLSGRLQAHAGALSFAGPASVDSNDPAALLALLERPPDADRGSAAPLPPLRISGDLAIDGGRFAIEKLKAEIDRRPGEGRIAYAFAGPHGPARLDAALAAAEIDLDGAVAAARAALGETRLDWPREVALALFFGKAVYAGVEAKRVEAKLSLDGAGLNVERLTVGDLRGASLKGAGQIDLAAATPQGMASLSLEAPRADGLIAILGKFAPQAADQVRRFSGQLGPVDLKARLDLAPAKTEPAGAATPAAATQAKLAVAGKLGAVRVNLTASGAGDKAALLSAQLRVEGAIESEDGRALAALAGVDRFASVEARPASLALVGNGRLDGEIAFDLRLSAGGLTASGAGTARRAKDGVAGAAAVSVTAADIRPLVGAAGPAALPVALESRVAFEGWALAFEDLKGRVAGAGVKGRLGLRLATPLAVDGQVEATDLDAADLIAAAIGAPRRPPSGQDAVKWPGEPFGPPLFSLFDGSLSFVAARAALLPGLVMRDLKGRARVEGGALFLDDVKANVADGGFLAEAVFRPVAGGLAARGRIELAKADLAQIGFGRARLPAIGGGTLSVSVEGTGRSPAALVGALRGGGAVAVENAQFAGLDPKAIDAALRAADRGLAPDRLAGYLTTALDAGRLRVAAASGALAIADGRVRLGPVAASADGVAASMAGSLDLTGDALDLRISLAGSPSDELPGKRPEVSVAFEGPLAAPKRRIDAAALANYVTLRAIERAAKRVEAAERAMRERAEQDRLARERTPAGGAEKGPEATGAIRPDPVPPTSPQPAPSATPPPQRAPDLPPPIEIKPAPGSEPKSAPAPAAEAKPPSAKPARPAPPARPAQAPPPAAPPNRPFWDNLFGRP